MDSAWSDKYSLGVDAIDDQHKELFRLVADLERLINAQAGVSEIQHALNQLLRWAEIHFAAEETLLRVSGYPSIEPHIGEHQTFLDSLRKNIRAMSSRPLAYTETKVFGLLATWLQTHILEIDRHYVPHLEASIQGSPVGGKGGRP